MLTIDQLKDLKKWFEAQPRNNTLPVGKLKHPSGNIWGNMDSSWKCRSIREITDSYDLTYPVDNLLE